MHPFRALVSNLNQSLTALETKTKSIVYNVSITSSSPYLLVGPSYMSAIIMVLVANVGSKIIGLTKDSTSTLVVKDLMTGANWTNSSLQFAIVSGGVQISTGTSGQTNMTIFTRI